MKRLLSVILMITMLLGNTMSVSATSSSIVGDGTEVISTEDISADEEKSSEDLEVASEDAEESGEVVTESKEEAVEETEVDSSESETESAESSEEADTAETEAGSEEIIEETTESVTETAMEESTEVLFGAGVLSEQPESVIENTSTDKIVNWADVSTAYCPEEPVDVSSMSYTFKSETNADVSSLNSSSTKYRLLLFAPVEAFRDNGTSDADIRGMWEEFYLYNALLLSSSYVDTVVLDTGHSEQSEIKDIHEAADDFNSGDTSVFCYDKTESETDNKIWQAYNAYCDLFEIQPATHWVDYYGDTTPCAVYFLINEKNEIVLYGYGNNSYNDVVSYVVDNAIVKPTAPTGITVTNMQGKVTFSWTMSDAANTAEAYCVWEDDAGNKVVDEYYDDENFEYDGKKATYVINTSATGEEDNPICRYQFRERYNNNYGIKSEYSETKSNEGMECPRNPELIKEARFIDTRISDKTDRIVSDEDGITIHVGETVKMDIELERYSTQTEKPDALDTFRWYMSTSADGMSGIIKDEGPVKYWVDSFENMTGIYIKGEELTGNTTYYMVCDYWDTDSSFSEYIIVPVHVIAAESGVPYEEQEIEAPADLYTSLESLREAVTTHLKNGDEVFTVAVNDDDWEDWGVSVSTLGMPQAFWDEEPWVLNYSYIFGGTIWSPTYEDTYLSVRYKTEDYRIYNFSVEYDDSYGGFYAPYEWLEGQVDKLVNQPGGALYEYKNADEYTRIKAVYDWVRKNVSYKGTTDGLYHSAYGAMKTKKATCEGYQQITYRLLWEMGIPNCCMTDNFTSGAIIGFSSVHAYNMVELEGKAYYLDTTSGTFLKGTKSVGPRDYQEYFYDSCERFINMLSEEDYVYVPKNLQLSKTVGGETTSMESLNSFAKVKEAIENDITENGKADFYSIFMTDNMELSDDSLNNSDIKINLDLNGHTLKVTKDVVSTAYIYGGSSKTGSVKIAENATFTVEATDKETEVEKVTFAYEGTNSTLVLGSEDSKQTLTLKNIVSGTANHLKIFGDVEYTGSMTAQKLTLEKGQLTAGALTVKGDTIAAPEHKLLLSGNASFKNMTVKSVDAASIEIGLLYSADGSKKGALTFTGSLINSTAGEYAVTLKKYDCTSGTPIQKEFTSGEKFATVTIAADKFDESNIQITQSGFYVERDGNNLLAAIETVEVSYYDEKTGTTSRKMYSSLKNAITGLNTLAAKKAGTYTFTFVEDCMLSADATLPSFVKEAVVTTFETATLDFNGYKLKTPGNLTLNNETLVLTDANIDANTLSIPSGNRKLDTVTVKTLDLSDGQSAEISIKTLKASTAIKLGAQDILRVQTATGIKDVELKPGALFIADNFTQISSGKTYAWADSVFVVNETATIYNPILNADTGVQEPVYIYKTEAAKINLLGKLTRTAPQTLISVGMLTQEVSTENGTAVSIILQDYTEKTALFDTKISKFPLDVVKAEQASADSTSEYNVIYQIGTTVYVGKIVVKASGTTATGATIEEKGFAKWSDAIAYLNTYAHAKAKFEIGVLEDFDTNENLTMPKKAESVWIYGGEKPAEGVSVLGAEESVSLTYLGDISLVAETTIANIDLHAKKYNSKSKAYEEYKSALKLNGKALTLTNVSADLTNVAGNAKAVLTLDNAEIAVTKAVSSLGYLYMTDSSLAADNVTVTNTLSMNSARIDCVNKITLNNVISESEDNVLAYGGNTSKNNLTIKGNVTFSEDADKTVDLSRKDNEQVIIRKNAITLKVKSMEPSSYTEGAILCNAQKAGSSWFVVGSEWNGASERTAVAYGTYKKNKDILCGELGDKGNVNLYSSKSGNENSYVFEGGFTTLQDALSEIDKLAIKENYYQIELMKSDKDVVTFTNKALTFPSKTAGITIMADSSMEGALPDPKIYFKGNLTLKSNTVFEEIVFAPVKNASVSLGNFSLTLSDCSMDSENMAVGFSQISGSGVKKNSALILDDTALTVLGNVNNVGKLVFTSEDGTESKLISYGTVNVGNIELNTDATLGGLATVTRKKVSGVNTVTKIASKITINGDVTSNNGSTLYLDLYEKVGKVYQQLDFDADDMDTIEASGIQMAKGLLVTYPNVKPFQRNNETSLIKSAGYLLWYPNNYETGESEHGAELRYTVGNEEVVIPCLTIGDAVTEINNQKVKRDYTITLTKAGNETSGAVQNGSSFMPKAIKMPTAKYINSLVLEGEETSGIKLGYLSNITFTCDTTLRDIDFVQMVKVKNEYLAMDEAKANYPAAVTVNTGGFALNIEGMVTFNTPVTLNGKNTGTLTLNGEGDTSGTIATLTNQNDVITAGENVIYGSVTAFKNLEVSYSNLTLKEYKASATSNSYKASTNKVTNLRITGGNITVVDERAKSSFTVTGDTDINEGKLIVNGKVVLKNVTIIGNGTPTIKADTDFTINGTLKSRSDTATLITRRKGVNKAPYLNIKGEVILDEANPIYVGVYEHFGSADKDKPVKLTNAPQVTAQLLTAAKAPADVFRPIDANTNGHGPYSESNTQGYWLSKVRSNIYVYEGK